MTPTLIVTRPTAQSASFAARIAAQWDGPLDVIQSPLLEIVPLAVKVTDVDEVIFTSANGVAAAAGLGLPKGLPAWCVGERTAQCAKDAGFVPMTGPGDADGLVQFLLSARPAGTLAHIRGKHARGDVCAQLNAAGLQCRDVIAYDQRARKLTDQARFAVNADKPVVFPLFSPRTSTILNEQGPFGAPVYVVAISQAVADAFDSRQATKIVVASSPDADAMGQAVLAILATARDTAR